MDLSIIIPVFEESKKIASDIAAAADFLVSNNLTGEIIVVDDGSKDGTAEVAEKSAPAGEITLRVIRLEDNRGKGYAVRTGMRGSTGKFAMFADSGGCVPYDEALRGMELIESGQCDIAHASRKITASHILRPQSRHRKFYSRLFKWVIKTLLKIPSELTDTQCGFKIYRGDVARQLYAQCTTNGFVFDVEIIMRAQKHGYRIKEFPIDWKCDCDSRITVLHAAWRVIREIIAIRINL